LTEGNITIGGKTTTAKDLGLNTDAASANTAVNKLPDLKQLLADQKAMAAAAATVIETSQQIAQDVAKSAEAKKKALINVAENDIKAQGQQAWDEYSNATPKEQEAIRSSANADYKNAADTLTNWGAGGDYTRAFSAVTSIVVGGVAGQGGAQIAGNAAAPYAASLIGQQFDHTDDPNKAAQLLSHAVLGATLAYLNGGNAAAGAAAGAGSEAAAQYLTKELYPEAFDANGTFDRTKLTEEQANHIIGLGAGIGALVGGATGGSVFDGAVGGEVGRNAVESNNLGRLLGELLKKQAPKVGAEIKILFDKHAIPAAAKAKNAGKEYLVKSKEELKSLWQVSTKNAEKVYESAEMTIHKLEDGTRIIYRDVSSWNGKAVIEIQNAVGKVLRKVHLD
jgi:filamentous hemagglutinin